MLNALRAENRAAYDRSEAKRALTQIKGLKDLSDKCEEYAPGEEIQTMRIDDRYFVSSNWRTQSDALNTDTNKANVARLFETSASRVSHANTPKNAAARPPGSFKVLIIQGQAIGSAKLHAEQNLLLTLAYRLRGDDVPRGFLAVAGKKVPCLCCRKTLQAFAGALLATYDVDLHYNKAETNPDGSPAKGAVVGLTPLSLDDVLTGDPKEPAAAFKTFVADYKARLASL